MIIKCEEENQCLASVSYTHLDVYKRQGHTSTENVPRGRQPKSASTPGIVKKMPYAYTVLEDWRLGVDDIADVTSISH